MSKEGAIRKMKADKVVFFICLGSAVGLIVGGFFVPPMGVIDGSILTAAGELLGFAALAVGAQAIQDGRKAVIRHKDTQIDINEQGK